MGLIVVPLLVLFIVVAFFITRKLGSMPEKKGMQLFVKGICVLMFVGLFAGDAIIGRIYLKHLCTQDGGIVINETIEVGSEYFDNRGRFQPEMKTIETNDNENIRSAQIEHYKLIIERRKFGGLLRYRKLTYEVINQKTNSILGKSIQYSFNGGWFENLNVGSSIECPKFEETERFFSIFRNRNEIGDS